MRERRKYPQSRTADNMATAQSQDALKQPLATARERRCGCLCHPATLCLLSPLLLCALVLILGVGVSWGLLGLLLTSPIVSTIMSVTTLASLMVADALQQGSSAYGTTAFDVGVIAAAFLLINFVLAHNGASKRSRLGFNAVGVATTVIYAIVKGSVRHGSSDRLSGVALALTILSAVLTFVALLETARVWRPASPACCAAAERRILNTIVRTPFTQSTVAGMHTVTFGQHPDAAAKLATDVEDTRPVLVMCHGYMSGSAMYMFNFDAFTPYFRVYAVDWIGCGASDRPTFAPHTTAEAEDFFLGAFENWRQQQGLEQFVLMGHSLGGYLTSLYAIRYPSRVTHLVLVSPAGMTVNTDKQLLGRTTPGSPTPMVMPRFLWATVTFLWEKNFTPGIMLRFLGPLGPWLSNAGVRGRASRWVLKKSLAPIAADLGDYFFHNIASDGSGEFALNFIFEPGAHAREPVAPRLIAAATPAPGHGQRLRCPVLMAYGGSHDWMSAPAGGRVCAGLRELGLQAECVRIPESGHHLYLENPDAFNAAVLRAVLPASGAPITEKSMPGSRAQPAGPADAAFASLGGIEARIDRTASLGVMTPVLTPAVTE